MIKGVTSTGFEFEVDETKLKDMRMLRLISKCEKGDGSAFLEALPRFLGEDQEDALYSHLEKLNGVATPEDTGREFGEIVKKAGENLKNS